MCSTSADTISLDTLALAAVIGPDCWDRVRAQPVLLSLDVHAPLAAAATSDDVADTLHYGHLCSALLALQHTPFDSLFALAEAAAAAALRFPTVSRVRITADAPKLLLHAAALSARITREGGSSNPGPDRDPSADVHPPDILEIRHLALPAIIGVNPPERVHTQQLLTSVSFHAPPGPFPHRAIVDRLASHIKDTSYRTLEAFATSVARVACAVDGMDRVTVRAQKPSAVAFAHSSAVQVSRDRAFFEKPQ